MSSWFRSSSSQPASKNKLSVPELVQHLYPPPPSSRSASSSSHHHPSRFSTLLLEHGEQILLDYAVTCSSSLSPSASTTSQGSPRHHTNTNNGTIQWAQSPTPSTSSTTTQKNNKHKRHSLPVTKEHYPTLFLSRVPGRLHLCTSSLVFEPHDTAKPILRFCWNFDNASESVFQGTDTTLTCTTNKHVCIKANHTIGPYTTVHKATRFVFDFVHSKTNGLVNMCVQLQQQQQQDSSPKNRRTSWYTRTSVHTNNSNMTFDTGHLVDVLREQIAITVPASWTTPLMIQEGLLLLTTTHLYFQTIHKNLCTQKIPLSHMVATARRYHGLRDSGLEIYVQQGTGQQKHSILWAFERRHDREQLLGLLPQTIPCLTDRSFLQSAVSCWQEQGISNFEYLLVLNGCAGRSFHDLSRYPVFPWVLADYSSKKLDLTNPNTFRDLTKPVGALNAERLQYFQTRMRSMQDMEEKAFLYGTHYSAPGYVLYFLVRSMPEHMLCLQNGKFDAPDRMFHSIEQCYKCCMSNHADVKELIPEFYHSAGHDTDFLMNVKGLQLGATQNGDRVDDVQLPAWARSPRDFLKQHNKALECEYVTKRLPRWIDLIFGCTSRGDEALQADNLFHKFAYLGPTDLASMQTEQERFQAELQATEFGIVPDLLFCSEHPLRNEPVLDDGFISPNVGRASSKDESAREAWELLDAPTANDSSARDGSNQLSPSDSPVPMTETEPELAPEWNTGQSLRSSVQSRSTSNKKEFPLQGKGDGGSNDYGGDFGDGPTSSRTAASPDSQHASTPKVQTAIEGASASTDWNIEILERKHVHSDAISGCVLSLNEPSILVTTSLDGGLKVQTVNLDTPSETNDNNRVGFTSTLSRLSTYSNIISRAQQIAPQNPARSKLTEYRSHTSRDPLASLVVAGDNNSGAVAFAGGHDDVVLAYGVKSACAVASVYSHRDAVTGLDLVQRGNLPDSAIWREKSTHIMVSGSWDATVKVWSAVVDSGETVSIDREPLAELFDADSSIVCVSAISVEDAGIMIAAGCSDGSFCVWNLHQDGVQVQIHNEAARQGSGPCSVAKWVLHDTVLHLFAGYSTGKLVSYTLDETTLRRQSAVSVGVGVSCLASTEDVLLVGCADGGLRVLPLRNHTFFEAQPILWRGVNNKKSNPSITSLSLVSTLYQNKQTRICCTGAEDGSVVLFELQKVVDDI